MRNDESRPLASHSSFIIHHASFQWGHLISSCYPGPRRAPMVVDAERAITLGHPSYVWRSGQERRLDLIRRYAPLEGKRVLDIGCGLGAYVANFGRFTDEAYGMDVDEPR